MYTIFYGWVFVFRVSISEWSDAIFIITEWMYNVMFVAFAMKYTAYTNKVINGTAIFWPLVSYLGR